MTKKISAIVVALALGAVALAPIAAAHLTAASLFLPGDVVSMDGTTDKCRAEGTPSGDCTYNDGMSGTYRGTGGVHVSSDQFPLAVQPLVLVCVGRTTYDDPATGLTAANRFCEIGTPSGCDAEYIVAGEFAGNEEKIEGGSDANTPGGNYQEDGGSVPDGLFDDGGDFGAVCHSNNGPASWSTLGCGTVGEQAFAKDANPLLGDLHPLNGDGVWISNECDYLSPIFIEEEGNQWFDCVVNEGVLGEEGLSGVIGETQTPEGFVAHMTGNCVPMIVELIESSIPGVPTQEEIEEFIAGLTTPVSDDPVIGFSACGGDAGPDKANYGYGGAGVANVLIGMDNPITGTAVTCDPADATQWGFVRDYVNVDLNGGAQPTDAKVGVSSGWYDVR